MNSIPFIDLKAQQVRLRDRIDEAIARVLDHGRYILGPEVGLFEEELAQFTGAGHVVSCANGTDALTLVLLSEEIGPGDAVLVPSMTFVATVEPVLLCGATPVYVDIDSRTFNMSPGSLRDSHARARKAGLRPRAIIPVDLYGLPADYDAIMEFAEAHGPDGRRRRCPIHGGPSRKRTYRYDGALHLHELLSCETAGLLR